MTLPPELSSLLTPPAPTQPASPLAILVFAAILVGMIAILLGAHSYRKPRQ